MSQTERALQQRGLADRVFRRRRQRAIYQNTFGSEWGRQAFSDLALRCGMFRPSFEGDPLVSAFNEGARGVFLYIVQQMNLSEEQILALAEEENE